MEKSAQDRFNDLVAERDELKEEINKWIYTASVFERDRDSLVSTFKLLRDAIGSALRSISKKT